MTEPVPVRYRSPDEDSARWSELSFRPGDIVISTRSKSGTTWVQMICALLVFQRADLPVPLAELSPWVDWLGTPAADLFAQLDAQQHRRFLKTHTPLDGIPLDGQATYIVVARHPLDMAVSLYHQGDNLDREKISALTGQPVPAGSRPTLTEWLPMLIASDADPRRHMDSLPGVMAHLRDAWSRREDPNVVLVHYADLSRDLEGEMRRLAARLAITVPEDAWPELVAAATFEHMKQDADRLAPDAAGILKDRSRFFRGGTSGAGRAALSPDDLARYDERARELAPPDLLEWLHR